MLIDIKMAELCGEHCIDNVDCLLVVTDNNDVLTKLEPNLLKETDYRNQLTRRGRQSKEFGFCGLCSDSTLLCCVPDNSGAKERNK